MKSQGYRHIHSLPYWREFISRAKDLHRKRERERMITDAARSSTNWAPAVQVYIYAPSLRPVFPRPNEGKKTLMALFHCMVRHGTVRYGSLLGGFPLRTVPSTWYFFSTTSVEVPCKQYRYQNVTCKLCWSPIGRRKSPLLRHWTCDTRPSSTRSTR